jgi:hypothetical protein
LIPLREAMTAGCPLPIRLRPPAKLPEESVRIENYEWQSDFAIKHQAEGEARAILWCLRGRGICVSDEARRRIMSCTDQDQLERWAERAGSVQTVDELFD